MRRLTQLPELDPAEPGLDDSDQRNAEHWRAGMASADHLRRLAGWRFDHQPAARACTAAPWTIAAA